jgi:DNA-binding MarR family transcriptional regulator
MRKVVQIAAVGKYQHDRLPWLMQLTKADAGILLYSEESKNFANEVKADLQKGGHFDVECHQVNPWDYNEILSIALDCAIHWLKQRYEVAFVPALGSRIMSAALMMAAAQLNKTAYLIKEEKDKAFDVIEIRPLHYKKLTKQKKTILYELMKKECVSAIRQLGTSDELGVSRSTKSGHIRDLEKWGYISLKQIWRSKEVCITHLGKIALKLAEYREFEEKENLEKYKSKRVR